jgi:hypothetical protein
MSAFTLKDDVVKEAIARTGIIPKCECCGAEIRDEEKFIFTSGPNLENGIVQHSIYFDCLQRNERLMAAWHEADRARREAAHQEWLKQSKEREKKEQEYRERGMI